MNKVLALMAILILTMFNSAYAFSDCPPSQKVKSMALKQPIPSGIKDRWTLTSDTFKVGHRDWNVFFIVELVNASNAKEALKQGKEAFETAAITNDRPVPYNSDGMTYCDYAREAKYTIASTAAVENGMKAL